MENNKTEISEPQQFRKDSKAAMEEHKKNFIHDFYPSLEFNSDNLKNFIENNTPDLLDGVIFYKLCGCTLTDSERKPDYFSSNMKKLFIEAYAAGQTLFFGIESADGVTSLLIGHASEDNDDTVRLIIEDALPEVKVERYQGEFESKVQPYSTVRYLGCITGIPDLKSRESLPYKDLPRIMRSLNGSEYTIMIISRPVKASQIDALKEKAVNIHDDCSAISRKTVSMLPEPKRVHYGREGDNIESYASEFRNSSATEMVNISGAVAERLKIGKNIGMWETVVSFSSNKKEIADFIGCSLYSRIASDSISGFPPRMIAYEDRPELQEVWLITRGKHSAPEKASEPERNPECLIIPKGFLFDKAEIPLSSLVTSQELCRLCTIPTENTAGFTVHSSRTFFQDISMSEDDVPIGKVIDRGSEPGNVPFGLSKDDVNKHVFVCGMTGSGKTNTVKTILESFDEVPYLVIEPAKKEYRNMKGSPEVYTFGRPEINCLRMNPFYIMKGSSPQQHIDLLKDLFSASFGFYGPLPYIFEKCLNQIYLDKGWNLTLGFHPFLRCSADQSSEELFSDESLDKQYSIASHKYLFPTMEDLRSELASYIDKLDYEKDVKGNIRSAIQSRIDSLCVGSKGYMFNTSETADFGKLLGKKAVIEVEGLADDSDKAFALGLLIVFINEYRQVWKELSYQEGLRHILVVEEAHRLLKNVPQERDADLGNPKGKAVEHFSNMLAEMRSYGQGVIVAEQIPSKLAPDVIKNSSVKIVHRIAASDDQAIVGNTIGLSPADAIALGANTLGIALCHKDGMFEPVKVKILQADTSRIVPDEKLYTTNLEKKLEDLSISDIKGWLYEDVMNCAVKILSSLMYQYYEQKIPDGLSEVKEKVSYLLKKRGVPKIPNVNQELCIKECLYSAALSLLTSGAFRSDSLPDNEMSAALHKIVVESDCLDSNSLYALYQKLEKFYHKSPEIKAVEAVADLVSVSGSKELEPEKISAKYLLLKNNRFGKLVVKYLEGNKRDDEI